MANLCCVWIKFILILLVCLVFPLTISETTRNLLLQLNPNCDEYAECTSSNVSIFYIKAIGPNDTIHYLWSTQGGIPSALIVQTNLNAELKINWTTLLSPYPNHAISFTENPFYSFGVLLTRLLQFVDSDDTGSMSNYKCEAMDFSNINWTTSSKIINESSHCSVTFRTSENSTEFLTEGTFYFQLSAYGQKTRGDNLPRLLHDSNNNEIGIILNHLKTNNKKSRFALECMAVYNSEEENATMFMKENRNLDDEFTPGIFSTVEVLTSTSKCNGLCNGYLFWKPIAYTDEGLSVSHSTDVKMYDIILSDNIPPDSIISAYFGFDKKVQISMWNVSFGMKKDNFYNSSEYTSWYLTIGLGTPPEDTPSLALILTIAIGFGTPFLCMVGGGIYMTLRKFLKKEDDLLLSRESM